MNRNKMDLSIRERGSTCPWLGRLANLSSSGVCCEDKQGSHRGSRACRVATQLCIVGLESVPQELGFFLNRCCLRSKSS